MTNFPTDSELRNYVWRALSNRARDIRIPEFHLHELISDVVSVAESNGISNQFLRQNLTFRIPNFLFDLIIQGVMHPKGEPGEVSWKEFRITDYGVKTLLSATTSCYDPDGYIAHIARQVPKADSVIIQYTSEAMACFRRNIPFACAVMLGAAAEKTIFLLFDSIIESRQDVNEQGKLRKIYENPNLPKIFDAIQKALEPLIAKNGSMPYDIHQGSLQHLLSLFEMIRVQRNESVHPTAPSGGVSAERIVMCLNSFPYALEVSYRLMGWFRGKASSL